MNRNIEGKVVIITGASSGLGESTVRRLGKLGATIVLGARRKDRLNSIVKDIQADGGKALAVAVDVTKRAETMPALCRRAACSPQGRRVGAYHRHQHQGVLYGIAAALPPLPEGKERSLHQHIFSSGYQGVCAWRISLVRRSLPCVRCQKAFVWKRARTIFG